jgi:hypothetical protein
MSGVELRDVDISGEIKGLRINGVDVTAYVEAELLRREPDLVKMHPDDPAGFREAWDLLERLWDGTVERARRLDQAQLHEQVDGEWSFIETLRHLSFATASWVHRAIGGDPAPWHPLDLPWDEAPEDKGFPRDRSARPSLDEVLELRRTRQADVRRVIEGTHRADARRRDHPAGRRRLAPAAPLSREGVPVDRAERGVVAPDLRRARPRHPRKTTTLGRVASVPLQRKPPPCGGIGERPIGEGGGARQVPMDARVAV